MIPNLFYEHLLYRLFDANDELLYVGRTNDLRRRFESHAEAQPWWAEVARSQVESLESFETLCEAERTAIVTERPKYNVVHNAAVRGSHSGLVPIPENPHFILIADQLWATTDGYAEDMQCAAIGTRGRRCRYPLDGGQVESWSEIRVPGGFVAGYDLTGHRSLGERFLAQRCHRHVGDQWSAVDTEWVAFDPAMHQPWITVTADGAVDAWRDLDGQQQSAVEQAAPTLAATLKHLAGLPQPPAVLV